MSKEVIIVSILIFVLAIIIVVSIIYWRNYYGYDEGNKVNPLFVYQDLLLLSGLPLPCVPMFLNGTFKAEVYKEEILRRLRRPKQPESENTSKSSLCNRHPEYRLSLLDADSTQGLRGCMEDLCKIYGIPAHLLVRGMQEAGKELNLKSDSVFKSSLSPESATSKGTITPPLSLSDIELRKYCIEQTNKDQVYLRIEDAQRLYDYILNGNQRGKEVTNEH